MTRQSLTVSRTFSDVSFSVLLLFCWKIIHSFFVTLQPENLKTLYKYVQETIPDSSPHRCLCVNKRTINSYRLQRKRQQPKKMTTPMVTSSRSLSSPRTIWSTGPSMAPSTPRRYVLHGPTTHGMSVMASHGHHLLHGVTMRPLTRMSSSSISAIAVTA